MPNSNFIVERPLSPQDFERYYKLRYDVLRNPWYQPKGSELDESDATSIHAFIQEKGEAIACGRLHFIDEHTAQIRYMAVHPSHQGKGLGKSILLHLEAKAQEQGRSLVVLHARENALEFYKKCGYAVKEKSYLLWDTIQHFLMKKNVT
ncbi:MAG: GNAT family N-acetyltransferase [Bacteroidetes bacterium]|nr:GNAT family N-acetyltransferase [Bacteroidota bacterium]